MTPTQNAAFCSEKAIDVYGRVMTDEKIAAQLTFESTYQERREDSREAKMRQLSRFQWSGISFAGDADRRPLSP